MQLIDKPAGQNQKLQAPTHDPQSAERKTQTTSFDSLQALMI
jgi:hypothetical protein